MTPDDRDVLRAGVEQTDAHARSDQDVDRLPAPPTILRSATAAAYRVSVLPAFYTREVTILCYHAVDPSWTSRLSVAPEAFVEQCAVLATRRKVLDLPDAVARLDGSSRMPRGTAAITFDDGFASVYEHAWPVLRDHGLPATVFLVARTLAPGGHGVDWVDDPPAHDLTTLTREQVLEMLEAGIGFGSHSQAHHVLPLIDDTQLGEDLRSSRELLEDLLGRPVPYLAYPRGRHDARVRAAARRAGYSHAFALPETAEPTGPQAIPRVGIYRHNELRTVRAKLSRWYLPTRTSPVIPPLYRALGKRPPNRNR